MHKMWSLVLLNIITMVYSAQILAVFPVPSISHQIVFRPLTQELAKRGHNVTVITTDPAFPKGQTQVNLTEIDVHDLSYSEWRKVILTSSVTSGHKDDMFIQMTAAQNLLIDIFQKQMSTDEVQKLIKDKDRKFDLLIIEAVARPALGFSHLYKVPLIEISSFLPIYNNLETVGAVVHPFLYPSAIRQKINKLTNWDKIIEMYNQYKFEKMLDSMEDKITNALRKIFGSDVPHVRELYDNIDLLFLNTYRLWDNNRPVPPSVIYLGGMHRTPEKELPKDLKTYLDSSKHGVIYMSFGTNVSPSTLPPEKIQIFVKVFSKLSYDILWKWDKDELPGRSANVKLSKWFPQSDLLRHPKIKLFITQGGLQSTDEAITAGVPLLCIPMLGDQWYNAEQYVRLNIGARLDMEMLTEETLMKAIDKIMKDNSYRRSIAELRALLADQPETSLSRAVWWTEHVLRHGGARHMRGPAANISWAEYIELELLIYLLFGLTFTVFIFIAVVYIFISYIRTLFRKTKEKVR